MINGHAQLIAGHDHLSFIHIYYFKVPLFVYSTVPVLWIFCGRYCGVWVRKVSTIFYEKCVDLYLLVYSEDGQSLAVISRKSCRPQCPLAQGKTTFPEPHYFYLVIFLTIFRLYYCHAADQGLMYQFFFSWPTSNFDQILHFSVQLILNWTRKLC